jgi:ABC-type glutathione transport system ATPase component
VNNGHPLVEVRNLQTYFPIRKGVLSRTVGYVKAVDGVSFDVHAGKTLGLVGESGCGKTTVGRTLLRLIPATGGTVRFNGNDFFAPKGEELRRLRKKMQIVFQDPVSSLNPRMTIGNIIGEPIEVHHIAKGREKNDLVASLLQRVGLDPATRCDIRTNSPAGSGNASASRGRWHCRRILLSAMSRCRHWMFRSNRRF